MALFVRFTQESMTAEGARHFLVYANLDQVSRATFDPQDGKLTLRFTDGNAVTLTGDEARSALETMQFASDPKPRKTNERHN